MHQGGETVLLDPPRRGRLAMVCGRMRTVSARPRLGFCGFADAADGCGRSTLFPPRMRARTCREADRMSACVRIRAGWWSASVSRGRVRIAPSSLARRSRLKIQAGCRPARHTLSDPKDVGAPWSANPTADSAPNGLKWGRQFLHSRNLPNRVAKSGETDLRTLDLDDVVL